VADDYLQKEGMYRPGPARPVSVREEGGAWVVGYGLRPEEAGGEVLVAVNKQTMEATGHVAFQ